MMPGKEKPPLTCVRGGKTPRYHPDLPLREGISSHPVTGMIRSALRGLLQSGCPAALARGFHHSPLALAGFAGLALSMRLSNGFIIPVSEGLSTGISSFFPIFSRGPAPVFSVKDTAAVRSALSAADAAGGTAPTSVEHPTDACRSAQNQDRRKKLHGLPSFPFISAYHAKGSRSSGICNSRTPNRGRSTSAGPGSTGSKNSWGSTCPPSGRGS